MDWVVFPQKRDFDFILDRVHEIEGEKQQICSFHAHRIILKYLIDFIHDISGYDFTTFDQRSDFVGWMTIESSDGDNTRFLELLSEIIEITVRVFMVPGNSVQIIHVMEPIRLFFFFIDPINVIFD